MSTSKLFGKDILITSTTNASGTTVGSISTLGGINVNQTMLVLGALTSTADSNTIGNLFTTSGNIGIGTTAPVQVLDVNGNLNITGNFYQNGSVYSGSTQWGSTGANIYFNTGNVGIGTLTPSAKLHLRDTGSVTLLIEADSDDINENDVATLQLKQDGGAIGMNIGINSSNDSYIDFNAGTNTSTSREFTIRDNNTTRLEIDTNGDIGIGTTSPHAKLTIITTGSLSLTSDGFDTGKIMFGSVVSGAYNTNHRYYIQRGGTTGNMNHLIIHTPNEASNGGVNFMTTNQVSRLFINSSSGNVGIDTTSPGARLHVSGACYMGGSVPTTTVSWGNITLTPLPGYETADIGFNTTIGVRHSISGLGGLLMSISTPGYIRFITGNVQNMVINTNGNVGIGIQSPNHKLEVSGAISQFSDAASNYNGYLKTNNSGQASTTLLNPGILLFNQSGTFNYGMDLGSTATGRYRTRIFAPDTADIAFSFAGTAGSTSQSGFTDRVVITGGGNVGIGTTAPAYTLDVIGTIDATSYTGSNISISGSITSSTLRVTGNADLSTGLTTVTDLTGTNITSGTIRASTLISTSNLSTNNLTSTNLLATASTITNLSIPGTLTVVNITSTNLVETNITAGGIVVTGGSLRATFNSNTIGNIFTTGGNVGIGNIAPNISLDFGSNYGNQQIALANLSDGIWGFGANNSAVQYQVGAGTNGSHVFYTASTRGSSNAALGVERMRITGTGNVGIGTTNPSSKLTVIGSETTTNGENSAILIQNTAATSGNKWWLRTGAVGTSTPVGGFSIADSSSYRMTFTSNGNIGIGGITNPVTNLHINTSNYAGIQFGNNDNSGWTVAKETNGLLAFYTGGFGAGTFRFGCTSTGNFGVNTASPSSTLHVVGTSDILTLESVNTNERSTLRYLTNGNDWELGARGSGSSPANSFYLYSNGAAKFAITVTSTGNVGLNTMTAPVAPLHVKTSSSTVPSENGVYIFNDINSANNHAILSVRTAGAAGGNPYISWDINTVTGWSMGMDNADGDKLKISSAWDSLTAQTKVTFLTNGNVGIGLTNPAFTLDVNGTIDATEYTGGNIRISGTMGSSVVDIGGNEVFRLSRPSGYKLIQTYQSEPLVFNILGNNVGIATTSPESKLHVNGGITLEGETVSYGPNTDTSSRTNTYIVFKHAGTLDDWAYMRQVGGTNAYKLAIDIHDDRGTNESFCVRSVKSTDTPDTIWERFTVIMDGQSAVEIRGNNNTQTDWPGGWDGGLATRDITCTSIYYSGLTQRSDIRKKENVQTYTKGLNEVIQLRPVTFNWKSEYYYNSDEEQYGFIAQEVEQIIPEIVAEDSQGYKNIKNAYIPLLVNSIKELKAELDATRAELAAIKTHVGI